VGAGQGLLEQEPKERPTASNVLETLLALGETYHHEPVVSVGDPDDEAMMRGGNNVEDGPEEGTFVGVGCDPGSDALLVYNDFCAQSALQRAPRLEQPIRKHAGVLLSRVSSRHHSGSDAHKSGGRRHRLGKHA
jgi:hypothetical protein